MLHTLAWYRECAEIVADKDNIIFTLANGEVIGPRKRSDMTLQDDLLGAFFNLAIFGQPEHFAARAEIERLRAKCAELERKLLEKESGITRPRAKRSEAKETE
jgi:hypothetical protein